MTYAFHVTKRENLDGILKDGLKPYDHKNFPHLQGPSEFLCRTCGNWTNYNTRAAVFVFLDEFTADWWAKFRAETYGPDVTILKIDTTGLELKEDYKLPFDFFRSYQISSEIAPDRIEALA